MQNLTEISNNELLDLYNIGNFLTRGRFARGMEEDKAALREYRKEIKARGFARIADFRATCAAERKAAWIAKNEEAQATEQAAQIEEVKEAQPATENAADVENANEVLTEAANAAEIHPGIYEFADNAGATIEDVEEFMHAIVYRIKKAGNMPDEESVLAAMDDYQRDMETEYLNALLQL